MLQPQINSLVVAGKYPYALKILENNKDAYGVKNYLLYLCDYGFVLHLAGRYEDSIKVLEEAKKEYDRLYTVSLTNEFMTWLINDNFAPYRGEDFERVLINIIQALNFAVLGDVEEALVEARDVDGTLSLINRQYPPGQKNMYKEDAFARLLMGILYEAHGSYEGINDAFISYQKSLESYTSDYEKNYEVSAPKILIENLLSSADYFDEEELQQLKKKFSRQDFISLKEKAKKGEIYLIQYNGLSPIKHAIDIPIPLGDGIIAKLAFPHYDKRIFETQFNVLVAKGSHQQVNQVAMERVEDIASIAIQSLENRKTRVVAKAMLRSAGKYILEESQADVVRKRHGKDAESGFKYFSSIFNLVSEQPDLRSWQTLPAEIYMGRLILEPGKYQIYLGEREVAHVELSAGDKKFFVIQSNH